MIRGIASVTRTGWLTSRISHATPLEIGCMLLAGAALVFVVGRIAARLLGDSVGGLLFDLLFSEGGFAERARSEKKLPNVFLLNHWRNAGDVKKAYSAARRGMAKREEALPVWLFAIETAAVHLRNWPAAIRLARRLVRCPAFSADEKTFVAHHLKGLAATQGIQLDIQTLRGNFLRRARPARLTEVNQLRSRGLYAQALQILNGMVDRDPENLAAGVMLVRVYAQDLRQRDRAETAIRDLEKHTSTPRAVIDFLRGSVDEWVTGRSAGSRDNAQPDSAGSANRRPLNPSKIVLEGPPTIRAIPGAPLLTADATVRIAADQAPAAREGLSPQIAALVQEGRYGTAVEELEEILRQEPRNLRLLLDLAQVQILHCGNLRVGERIVTRIDCDPGFTPEEKELALAKLRLWREQHASQQEFLSSLRMSSGEAGAGHRR